MTTAPTLQVTVQWPEGVAGLAAHRAPVPGAPVGPPRVWVARISRSLDFYLGLGCEVRCAADGWVLLGCGRTLFVLIQITAATQTHPRPNHWVRLTPPDYRALRRRLLTDGAWAGRITSLDSTAEMLVTDPDLYRVVIAEPRTERRLALSMDENR